MGEVTRYVEGTPAWADLMAADREAALHFYGELFGWRFAVAPEEYGSYTTCEVQGMAAAGIGQMQPPGAYPVAWTTYLAADDVDAVTRRVRDAGGDIVQGPIDVGEEGRMAIVSDPAGAVFGLWQAGRHVGARVTNEPGAMCWNEVHSRDSERARAFYAQVFGYRLDTMPGTDMDYVMLQLGDTTVGGIFGMGPDWPDDAPSAWMVYFAVDDADAVAQRAPALGGRVLREPWDTPYGRMVIVQDPQGAVFTAVRLPDQPEA